MSRIEILEKEVRSLYEAKKEGRADWADWLYASHVFIVAEYAGELADRFGAKREIAVAASMLHDVGDAVISRFDPRHEEESVRIARDLLQRASFSEEEISLIVDDCLRLNGCYDGNVPASLEGRVMATADALAHLRTDFYTHADTLLKSEKTREQIRAWALPKIERDFTFKIAFDDVREEVRSDYERLKLYFSQE